MPLTANAQALYDRMLVREEELRVQDSKRKMCHSLPKVRYRNNDHYQLKGKIVDAKA